MTTTMLTTLRHLGLTLALLTPQLALASYVGSPVNDFHLSPLQVVTESGIDTKLSDVVRNAPGHVLLVPGYYSCNSACPLLAANLRRQLQASPLGGGVTVIFLSFNPSDAAQDVQRFRRHMQLPAAWQLLLSADEAATRDFLAQFGYAFQKTDSGYDHPSSAFLLSSARQLWVGSIVGDDSSARDLTTAILEADRTDSAGPLSSALRTLAKPEYLAIVGSVGLIASLAVVIFVLYRRPFHSVPPSLSTTPAVALSQAGGSESVTDGSPRKIRKPRASEPR